jgi:MFS family permease
MRKARPADDSGPAGDRDRHPSRPWLVLARYRDFRWLFAGDSVSLLGSSVTTVALPLTAVVYLHASPAQMGVLGAVALLPHLVLGLPAGVWVDRVPYRRVLVAADLIGALRAARITHRIGQGPAFITGMLLAGSGGLVLAAAARPLPLTLAIVVMAQVLRGAGPSLYGVNQ